MSRLREMSPRNIKSFPVNVLLFPEEKLLRPVKRWRPNVEEKSSPENEEEDHT